MSENEIKHWSIYFLFFSWWDFPVKWNESVNLSICSYLANPLLIGRATNSNSVTNKHAGFVALSITLTFLQNNLYVSDSFSVRWSFTGVITVCVSDKWNLLSKSPKARVQSQGHQEFFSQCRVWFFILFNSSSGIYNPALSKWIITG